jgi:hypothetical protein
MMDFEKLGLFYLGLERDRATGQRLGTPVLYDSRDLLTHAVCVGMTGSGKTGLCLSLLEEAAIDGVPVLAIDPKGDLGNLLLTFPSLSAAEFRPWIDEDEARRAGLAPDAFAAAEAAKWRDGLAATGQDPARVGRLKGAADFTIYTPGSRAGVPVSILSSLAAPGGAARGDAELLAERASATATGLLTLAGADGTPRSREHTLVSAILVAAWRDGRDLDLAALIQQVQVPPFTTVGIVDVDAFFPPRERFDLAMRINGLLAAPGFDQWLDGAPLDPASLLYTADGRPRVAVFSIAHLGEAERMFFVSMLLNQVVAWMRTLTGTSSLRAVVYMDEIAGYLPPVAAPPSKAPFLRLLKQGRAFGVGVVLATQNPVDLDYKGLSNIGTWFLGRLQTDRDKSRMLDGLEGAAGALDRGEADRLLSALDKRVFLLHDVHAPAPILFGTRWTLCYLRGPLSREQIARLTPAAAAGGVGQAPASPAAASAAPVAASPRGFTPAAVSDALPVLPPGLGQYVLPGGTAYRPAFLGGARVTFADRATAVSETRDVLYAVPFDDGPVPLDWEAAQALTVETRDLRKDLPPGGRIQLAPSAALTPKNYAAWQKAFARYLADHQRLDLWTAPALKLTSRPGETEAAFRVRVQEAQREARDAALDAVRARYAPRQRRLEERRRRALAAVDRESQQASQQKLQTGLSMAATIAGALFGRRTFSMGNLGRATTAARGVGRSMKEQDDVRRAEENVEAVEAEAAALDAELRQETDRIAADYAATPSLTPTSLAPKRGGVDVQFVALGWLPVEGAPSA